MKTGRVIVDSSGWIEFFSEGPRVDAYAAYLKHPARITTPTIVLYETYKKVKREFTEAKALAAISVMNRTTVVPLGESTALLAADLSLKHALPMADAIVYATAFEENCTVVTSDAHFKNLERVVFVP
ncbi:MAG: hypothetical protein OHK006_20170 [Thermodesulfovibrionales bacterium]